MAASSTGGAGRRAGRLLCVRSRFSRADRGRQQLLLAPHCALGAVRPARCGDEVRCALLHQRAFGSRLRGDGADQGRSIRGYRRAGYRLDRQAGGRVNQWVRQESLRWHRPGALSRGLCRAQVAPARVKRTSTRSISPSLAMSSRRGTGSGVEVSSSNFPRFDRNHNTGNDLGTDTEMRSAQQTVQHSKMYPSHVLLPVIPHQ